MKAQKHHKRLGRKSDGRGHGKTLSYEEWKEQQHGNKRERVRGNEASKQTARPVRSYGQPENQRPTEQKWQPKLSVD